MLWLGVTGRRDGFVLFVGGSLLLAVAVSAFVVTARHRRHSSLDGILFSFPLCRLMLAIALALPLCTPPRSPPLRLFLLSRPRLHSRRLLIIVFIITCRMTRVNLLCDLQQKALTLLFAVATVARCCDLSLYPSCTCPQIQVILVYRTLNPLFIKLVEVARKYDKGNSVCPDIFRPCQLFRQHQHWFSPHALPACRRRAILPSSTSAWSLNYTSLATIICSKVVLKHLMVCVERTTALQDTVKPLEGYDFVYVFFSRGSCWIFLVFFWSDSKNNGNWIVSMCFWVCDPSTCLVWICENSSPEKGVNIRLHQKL